MIQWIKDHNPPFHLHFLLAAGVLNMGLAVTSDNWLMFFNSAMGGYALGTFVPCYLNWRSMERGIPSLQKLQSDLLTSIQKVQAHRRDMDKAFEEKVQLEVERRLRQRHPEYTVSNDDDQD